MGSPLWAGAGDDAFHRFLYDIRRLVKKNEHVCLASAPAFFMPSIKFGLFFDVVMKLDAHLFTQFCPNYKAILELRKAAGYKSFRVNSTESMKYGIRLRRELIRIESIDIPPEDVKPSSSCSSAF
jgi:elongator complex protein 4